jgi:hypothetical protein
MDFFDKLRQDYPLMYGKSYDLYVDEGWHPIILALTQQIQARIDWSVKLGHPINQVKVSQIKEKFGGLRFYYDGGDDCIDGMVNMAELWASQTCEMCGDRATKHTTGWIKNVCDKHFEEIEEHKRNMK